MAQQLATEEDDEALLHQQFRHRLRAEARRRNLRHHGLEGGLEPTICRETLHHGSLEQLEQT